MKIKEKNVKSKGVEESGRYIRVWWRNLGKKKKIKKKVGVKHLNFYTYYG